MNKDSTHDIEYLKKNFRYNPVTGYIESMSRGSYHRVGHIDGKGYISVSCKGRQIKAHRLAWFLYYGSFPTQEIDHINRIRTDNRIINLRDVDRIVNNNNRGMCERKTQTKFEFEYKKMEILNRILNGETEKTIEDLEFYFPYSFKSDRTYTTVSLDCYRLYKENTNLKREIRDLYTMIDRISCSEEFAKIFSINFQLNT